MLEVHLLVWHLGEPVHEGAFGARWEFLHKISHPITLSNVSQNTFQKIG